MKLTDIQPRPEWKNDRPPSDASEARWHLLICASDRADIDHDDDLDLGDLIALRNAVELVGNVWHRTVVGTSSPFRSRSSTAWHQAKEHKAATVRQVLDRIDKATAAEYPTSS